MRARRPLLLLALSLTTAIAACGGLPTEADETTPPPPAPTDSSKRDYQPWN